MRIINVSDEIFKFIPEHCDGAIFWMIPGFYPEYWNEEFLPICEDAGCYPYRYSKGIWNPSEFGCLRDELGSFYRLALPLKRLKCLHTAADPREEREAHFPKYLARLGNMFTRMNKMHCRDVAMNVFPGILQDVIQCLSSWTEKTGTVFIRRLYVVNLAPVWEFGNHHEPSQPMPDNMQWRNYPGSPVWLKKEFQRGCSLERLFSEYFLGYQRRFRFGQSEKESFFGMGREDRSQEQKFGTSLRKIAKLSDWVEPWLARVRDNEEDYPTTFR